MMNCATVLLAWTICFAASPLYAAPPAPAYRLLDIPASRVWAPIPNVPPCVVETAGGRTVYRMPCDFATAPIERAAWDLPINLDLSAQRGLQFQFRCDDPAPISGFTFYLKSGGGWYSAPFSPGDPGQWQTVVIDKVDMAAEGAPAGWGHIETLRIAAWKGTPRNTEFAIVSLGLLPVDSPIVMVLGDSVRQAKSSESATVGSTAQLTARLLEGIGLPFAPISDLDLTTARLFGKEVVILPYNPSLPAGAVSALTAFVQQGGKLLSFYSIPASVQSLLGIKEGRHLPQSVPGQFSEIRPAGNQIPGLPAQTGQASWNIKEMLPTESGTKVAASWFDNHGKSTGHAALLAGTHGVHMTHILIRDDPGRKRQMLLAMLGYCAPACWQTSAQWHLERAGAVGPYATFDAAQSALLGVAGSDRTLALLEGAAAAQAKAREAIEAGRYAEGIAQSNTLHETLLDAYCSVQRALPDEYRGFWCHDAFGVAGMTWDEAVRILAENGFTDLLTNQLWGGVAYYPSAVLPVSGEVKARGDQLAQCLAACKKYGVSCHVWKVNWNMGTRTPSAFRSKMKEEGRTQVTVDGTAKEDWLCPSNPANQQLEIDAMLEIAKNYAIDGLHFDYIRYPDRNACFCAGCRKRFEQQLGKSAPNWPGSVLSDGLLRAAWLDFRRAQITRVVAAVSEGARKTRPGIQISAAVFRTWPTDRDTIGQDWKLWCDRGYLDFVCPMDYTPHSAQFEIVVKQQQEWAGKVPCYPGIGLSVWPDADGITTLIEQIGVTRRLHTGGFTVFNYGPAEASVILPRCGMGITRRP